MKKLLWLCSWYPNIEEPLTGDFIERHAIAASFKNDVTVLFIKRVRQVRRAEMVRQNYSGSCRSVISYYSVRWLPAAVASFISFFRYILIQKRMIDEYIRERGRPDLIHVHICYKAGLGALYARLRYGIRYVVSEQWTIFCTAAKPAFSDQPFVARGLIKLVYRYASGCTAVSEYLAGELVQRFGITKPWRIPNVVDQKLFFPEAHQPGMFTFIHISTLNYQKNPEHIIEACRLLRQQCSKPFQMVVYGPLKTSLRNLVHELDINDLIRMMGEVPHPLLAQEIRKADALVLYSRYETFGCVIIEAFATGLPVIVSDIPVMREIVEPEVTGIFAEPENPVALASAMQRMMENYNLFDQEKLMASASRFSYENVALQFNQFYDHVTGST